MKNKPLGIGMIILSIVNLYDYMQDDCVSIYSLGILCGDQAKLAIVFGFVFFLFGVYLIYKGDKK